MIKCPGCGVKIQFEDENKEGYIKKEVFDKRENDFLCVRCYKLKHYNEITNEIVDLDFDNLFKEISVKENLIVCIIDCFDLLGSVIKNINDLFVKSDVIFLANKYDLFLRQNRPTKLRTYIKKYLKSLNINFLDVLVTSNTDMSSSNAIYEYIKKYYNNKDVYFVGVSNVGKSTIINTISTKTNDNLKLTTSNQVGTTLNISKFRLGDLIIFDTPGYYNKKQATYYLDKKSLNITIPKKFIKPRTYQLYKGDTIFINAFGYITLESDEKCGMTFTVSNSLMLYRTKQDAQAYYDRNLSTNLQVPNKKELTRLGNFEKHTLDVEFNKELVISGVGFIAFSKNCKVTLKLYDNIEYELRDKMI